MSDTPTPPALLTPWQLAEIRALSQAEQTSPAGTSRHTYGLAPQAARALPALLAHLDAQQACFDARDKELCAALDAREEQVKQALAGLLLQNLFLLPHDSPYRILGEACNVSVEKAAKALNISL